MLVVDPADFSVSQRPLEVPCVLNRHAPSLPSKKDDDGFNHSFRDASPLDNNWNCGKWNDYGSG